MKTIDGKDIFPVEDTIIDMCKLIEEKKVRIKLETESMNTLKEEVRGLMIENNLKFVESEEISVKVSVPHSFDMGWLKMKYKDLADRFIEQTTVTKVVDEISTKNKNRLKSEFKEAWDACQAEGTPRLIIKRRTK